MARIQAELLQNRISIDKLATGAAGSISNVELNVANNVLENWQMMFSHEGRERYTSDLICHRLRV
jgi:hypothetical protein